MEHPDLTDLSLLQFHYSGFRLEVLGTCVINGIWTESAKRAFRLKYLPIQMTEEGEMSVFQELSVLDAEQVAGGLQNDGRAYVSVVYLINGNLRANAVKHFSYTTVRVEARPFLEEVPLPNVDPDGGITITRNVPGPGGYR